MGDSLDTFLAQLTESGLMPADEIAALLQSLPADEQPRTAHELAGALVRRGRLTVYQAEQLLAGQGAALVLGNYVVLDKLGQGGMGLVLKAQHRRMKRTVALKLLSPKVVANAEAVRRFEREVEAAAKLEHPHIVTAYDSDEAGGVRFLVLQYVEGTDLAELVCTEGPLPIDLAVACIVQAARGLEYAHARGVVHRDIKPANLLLDLAGTVKVLDMGLARLDSADARHDDLTGTGQIMGTVDYMAPEQALSMKNADARSDIYSLGATLWHLVTGGAMYDGETTVQRLLAHQTQPAPSLRSACPQASPELDAVFARLVAKRPDERFASMAEVIAALESCPLVASPGSSPPPAPPLAPTIELAPHEATRLAAELQAARAGGQHRAAATTAPAPTAASAAAPTIALPAAQVDTDPDTQTIAPAPAASVSFATKVAGQPPLPTSRRRWLASAAVGGGGLLLLLAAIVFYVPTGAGVLRVEIDDPDIAVAIEGAEIVLRRADQGKDIKLSPGEQSLVVRRDDFQFETDKLVLKRGDRVTVRVELLGDAVEVRAGERLLGRHVLPPPARGRRPSPADAPPPVVAASEPPASEPPASAPLAIGPRVSEPPPLAMAPFDADQARRHQQAWAAHLGVPIEYTNRIGMRFRLIPPGEYPTGSEDDEIERMVASIHSGEEVWIACLRSEAPPRRVRVSRPFYLGVYEVTQGQFERLMQRNPAQFAPTGEQRDLVVGLDTRQLPVENVGWSEIREFCRRLNVRDAITAVDQFDPPDPAALAGYRLPTEAEWELACRAGAVTRYWSGDEVTDLERVAWFGANSGGRPHAVGQTPANAFGLHDLAGNVFERCLDGWPRAAASPPRGALLSDPYTPLAAEGMQVIRGGDWNDNPLFSRSAATYTVGAEFSASDIGFRLAASVATVKAALAAPGPASGVPGGGGVF